MKLIILGAPGAGKGTQAEIISDSYSIPIIGTGNLIRETLKEGSPIAQEIKGYMDSGQLVPDKIVIELLKKRLEQPDTENGYILDGFPRNLAQAQALEDMGIIVDKVLNISVDDDRIVKRMSGRRICGECGSSYHIEYKQPQVEGICDVCGGKLIVRNDDKPEIVQQRLEVYHNETAPLIDFYEKTGKLHTVIGQEEVKDTTNLVLAAMEEKV